MLKDEKLIEQGIVTKIIDSENAKIMMVRSSACASCDSMMCNLSNKGNSSKKSAEMEVRNTRGAKVGDRVEIALDGNILLNLSAMVYGIPILIILASLITMPYIFPGKHQELIAISIALGLTGLYYLGFWHFSKKAKKKPKSPVIVKIISNGI